MILRKRIGINRYSTVPQVEELKSSPSGEAVAALLELSAPELVAKALDKELNAPTSSSKATQSGPINDLTSMVVKKKKKPTDADMISGSKPNGESNGSGKRKAENEDEGLAEAKKPKI